MSQKPIPIVIVEDQRLLAQTLATLFSNFPEFTLLGCAADGEEGWKLCLSTRPAVVLVDIEMPQLDGLELGQRLLQEKWPVRVIVMSALVDPYTIWRVRQSGVHGYVEKTLGADLLLQAVRTVAAGGTCFSETFEQVKQDWLAQPAAFFKVLSDREQDVLQRVATGCGDERIALDLHISTATVAVHRKHIRHKLELHNDRDLVAYARQWGLNQDLRRRPLGNAPPPKGD